MKRENLLKLSACVLSLCAGTGVVLAEPDVIVGDIPDVSNYTTTGAVTADMDGPSNASVSKAYRAYAIGTTSCNLGDTPLTWIDCSDANNPSCRMHPVISQNIYRIVNGRFRQVGQAWLKHGFCALQGTVCSPCTPGGNCDALFPGCSDPYSSGLNGSQGGLGPKNEVNAKDGTFPYPWLSNGTNYNATLYKRLIVPESEITDASSVYIVSSMYVQPEDAQTDNGLNSESYRRITFSTSTARDMQLQGTTQRGSPGIFAWRDHGLGANTPDPNVFITPFDHTAGTITERYWVGAKAIDLGGGQWRYEYAIQNMNSDRSAQSFRVPLPAGAVVTNTGFHGIEYHSGEPYSNVPWAVTVSSNEVSWGGQTFAQSANANALRWDTVYSMWFECNVPPSGGAASVVLFKPGTPTSVSGSTLIPSPDGQFHPLNDACSFASSVGVGATSFSTVNATTDGPNECTNAGYSQIGSDVWYKFTATCAGTHVVNTCGSGFDTKIAVYNASCPTGDGTALVCNDDAGTGTGCSGSLQSEASFTAVEGQTYLIRVGGYASGAGAPATGSGTLNITAPTCGPVPPPNDLCANAIWLADVDANTALATSGTTVNGTNDGTANCGNSSGSADVWYKYRPTVSGNVTITTCDSVSPSFDTVLSVHSGACGSLAQLPDPSCNDDTCGLRSTVTVPMTAGTTYYIRVAGYNGGTGTFKVRVNGGDGGIPPSNDDCANRAGISLGSNAFTTVGATTDGPTHTGCNFNSNNQVSNDVWFNYPSLCDGNLTISTCGTANYNTKIAVYDNSGCTNYEARLLACSDDTVSCASGTTEITIPVVSNRNYTIRVGGFGTATGSGSLVLTCTPTGCVVTCDFNQDGGGDTTDVIELADAVASGTDPYPQSCMDYNQDGGADTSDVIDMANDIASGTCP